MKKYLLLSAIAILFSAIGVSCSEPDKAITKKDGMILVNTAEIENEIRGYNGPVPVIVFIKNGSVVKVEMQENTDGPRYNAYVREKIGTAWDGQKLEDAALLPVDAVSGATFTSEALIQNVRLGITYYLGKQKK